MAKESKIILVSSSSRRVALLKQIKIFPYKIISHKISEDICQELSPSKRVKEISYQKALYIKNKIKSKKYIIAADTMVVRGKKIFNKTDDTRLIKQYLKQLSGKKHTVFGGICIISPTGVLSKKVIKTDVFFRRLLENDFNNQELINDGRGKAGGYAIQSYGSMLVKKIRGSYFNIVGLSIYDVLLMLKGLGWSR